MIENDRFTNQEIEKKLCSLDENQFTKSILVPLFESIFSASVQFTGGPLEKGRDLLISRIDELDEKQYIAVQVKKLKITGNTQKKGSFQQLLIQLSQASSEKVIDPANGQEATISKVIFVTPYTISEKTLDSHRSTFREYISTQKLTIIDGSKVCGLIKKHRPELIKLLFEPEYILKSSVLGKLKNECLMRALDVNKSRYTSEIYCEISFLIGSDSQKIQKLSKIEAVIKELEIPVQPYDLSKYKRFNKSFSQFSSSDLFDLSKLEKPRIDDDRIKKLGEEEAQIKKSIARLKETILKEIKKFDLSDETTQLFLKAQSREGEEYQIALEHIEDTRYDFTKAIRRDLTKTIRPSYKLLLIDLKKHGKISEKLIQSLTLITLYVERLSDFYNKNQKFLIATPPTNVDQCKHGLKLAATLTDLDILLEMHPEAFQLTKIKNRITRPHSSLTLETIFQTNFNIAIIGDAGSGKTTSLQTYARRLLSNDDDRFVIFISLVELGSYADKQPVSVLKCIIQYLNLLNIRVSSSDINAQLNSGSAVLLLDSIDEGIALYPEIVESLSTFVEEFPKCQVITSSRAIALSNLSTPFHQVSLLPFDMQQLSIFIHKWFGDDSDSPKYILSHLRRHKNLSVVVTNPLSATILCILYQRGVQLPKSEASLFNTRLGLLAGKFDKEKGVNRLENSVEIIMEAAKIIGYEIHTLRKRTASHQEIQGILIANRIGDTKQDREKITQDLLISEIMIRQSKNELTFGHLRFQEYLAAEEFNNRRSIKIDKLLKDQWWHGPLLIYSQIAREVEWLINNAISNGYTRQVKEILRSIVSERNKEEKEVFERRIGIAISNETDDIDLNDIQEMG